MKISFLLFISLTVFQTAFAQEIKIIMYHNTSGATDTIVFGYNALATIDLDTFLGEKNISNQAWRPFEFRIFQRERSTFSCAYRVSYPRDTIPVYFSNSFDSKRNFRKLRDTSYSNRFFEIALPNSTPLTTFRILGDRPFNQVLDSLLIMSDTCLGRAASLNGQFGTTREVVINTPNIFRMMFLFKTGFVSNSKIPIQKEPNLYPNPFLNDVTIDLMDDLQISFIKIFDIIGSEVFYQNVNQSGLKLNLSHLPRGLYLLTGFDKNLQKQFTSRLVKK